MVLLASTPPLVSWAGPDFKPNLFQPFKILAKKAGKKVEKQYGTYVLVLPSCSTTYVEVSCFLQGKFDEKILFSIKCFLLFLNLKKYIFWISYT